MATDQSAAEARILEGLELAARHHWGDGRRAALDAALRRMSGALATVAGFALPPETPPFPTDPEADRD